jgi:large subunit ribosomal protein L6
MSKLAKRPITIPDKTDITVTDGVLIVSGPKGKLSRTMRPEVDIAIADKVLTVSTRRESKFAHALWGTYAAHIRNMIEGVTTPFVKKLVIEGIGYRAEIAGKTMTLLLGFSHPVKVEVPEGVTAVVEKNVITITGIDKEQVGQFAATIRAFKKPEPYKGKGIRYDDEVVRRKQGKKATA